MTLNRREVVAGFAAGAVTMSGAGERAKEGAMSNEKRDAGVGGGVGQPGKHAIVPLPFNPARLTGLSERLIRSHHENNYGGAVNNLNKVELELARTTKDTPPFVVGGLRERELTFNNSMVLHEHYFGNLGGDGKPQGPIQSLVSATFGSFGRWEELFRATGGSLAGGSGWVVMDYNFQTNQLGTHWSGNHSQNASYSQPLLVMDMYEHAYALDYGAAAAKYVDAFFRNIQWDEVNRRLERAQKMAAVGGG
jgi:Fe-Mn family superoxide dismutase